MKNNFPKGMKPAAKPAPESTDHTVSFHVTNCTAKDAKFLGGVLKLFCDPQLADMAKLVRAGTMAIEYNPATGEATIFDLQATIRQATMPGAN